jgi:hypothetical protein
MIHYFPGLVVNTIEERLCQRCKKTINPRFFSLFKQVKKNIKNPAIFNTLKMMISGEFAL